MLLNSIRTTNLWFSILNETINLWLVTLKKFLYFCIFHFEKPFYEGCLLYFGIREQKQILTIDNRFIVFQSIPH